MIADPDIRKFFEALQAYIPDVSAIITDDGMTVAVRRPSMPPTEAVYIAREFRPQRDGKIGYYALTQESLEEIVKLLQPV